MAPQFSPETPPRRESPGQTAPPVLICFNCDGPVEQAKDLFCSELCQQTAKTVRYARAVYADGRIERPDVAEALKIRIGIVVGGGYPEKARRLTVGQRQAIFDRDGGVCQECGAQATEIDHIGPPIAGGINHPDNLQALCKECHRKTLSRFRPIETDEELHRAREIYLRVHAPEPIRICDAADWKDRWRTLRKERVALAAEEAA